ncbi:unnamed protein product, partial [marine sediment metagenome]
MTILKKSVSLNPGESKAVGFAFTPSEAKVHSVLVNGLAGSFIATQVAVGMITLYATGLRTVYWPGGVILEGTPYERYLPPGNYADWYADWYYAETGRYRTNYEDYQDLTTQNDPCTPPEPIDLNNLLIRVNDYSDTEICPATGHKGACRWGPFGPFVVE